MKRVLVSFGSLLLWAAFSNANLHAQYLTFASADAGWYWRVDAGAVIPEDGHIKQLGPWASGQNVSYDVGFGLDLGLGYAYNQYIATELEFGGTWTYIDSIQGAATYDSSFGTAPILANLILQYPIAETRIVPYVGGGVGGAATFFDTDGLYFPVPGGEVSVHGSDSDFVFAWQGLAGVRVALNSNMSVGLSYRYLHVDPSTYTYGSWYHHGPDLDLGFSSQNSHIVGLTFSMKF